MATIIVDKFINLIGFDFTKESKSALQSVENGIKSLRKFALVSAAALTGLGVALDRVAAGIDDQAKFARGIDVSFEKLQALQFAAQKAGVPVEELNSFLENLAKTSASTLPGQYNAALLQLGVSAKDFNNKLKDPITLFLELSDAIKKNPEKLKQVEFGSRLSASVKLVNLLGEGTDKIVKDMKELKDIKGVIPESVTKNVAEFFDDTLLKVNKTLSTFSKLILVSFLPAVSKTLTQLDKWIVVNEGILSSNIGDFIKGVTKGFEDFSSVIKKVAGVAMAFFNTIGFGIKNLDILHGTSSAVEGILLAVTAGFVASKFELILLGAAFIKVATIMDEVFRRADKLINIFSVEFPQATKVLKIAIEDLFSPIDTLLRQLDRVSGARHVLERFGDTLSKINPLRPIFDLGKNIDATPSALALSGGQQSAGGSTVRLGATPQTASAGGSSSSVPSNSTNNVTINVNGAGDPKAVAREVTNQMELSKASKTANPGFNRPRIS